MSDILKIEDLVIQYDTDSGCVHALNGLSLTLREGETLGLVGETGAGKTTLARSIMGLIQCPPGKIVSGKILYRGEDLLTMKEKHRQSIRGKEISMIFQDPMTSLNPVTTVGDQIAEAVMAHEKIGKKQAWEKALEMLETVGISRERASDYPHQFSGGMKQRVIIAIALVLNPKILLADEPTTALDVTIQAQILALLNTLKEETGTAVLMITHDLGVVAEVAQQVAVMYAGQVVEQGSVEAIFADPQHPYTIGLMGSIPSAGARKGPLATIPGAVPLAESMPKGCRFATRCPFAQTRCHNEKPSLTAQGADHLVACFRVPLEQHIALGEIA
ncbi:MAG: ABC transporter ATP-binding protein [Enterobacter cloacae]|nr:ABC transporter ATP-binding protein [Enterobacter cloacae]